MQMKARAFFSKWLSPSLQAATTECSLPAITSNSQPQVADLLPKHHWMNKVWVLGRGSAGLSSFSALPHRTKVRSWKQRQLEFDLDAVIELPNYTGAKITELNVVILHIVYVTVCMWLCGLAEAWFSLYLFLFVGFSVSLGGGSFISESQYLVIVYDECGHDCMFSCLHMCVVFIVSMQSPSRLQRQPSPQLPPHYPQFPLPKKVRADYS